MKRNIGIIIALVVLGAIIAAISCSLDGSDEDEDRDIAAPTLTIHQGTIIVTSAPIKNTSFLSTVDYANIFRQKASSAKGADKEDWVNIGQVSRVEAASTLTEFSFIDYYVSSVFNTNQSAFYRYKIRYHTEDDDYVVSTETDYIDNSANTSAIGEQNLEANVTLYYYGNEKIGRYSLNISSATDANGTAISAIDNIKADFAYLCILLSNGNVTRPFNLAEPILDLTDTSLATVAIPTEAFELHEYLPPNFLDVRLKPKGIILVRISQDDTGKYNSYYWTPPKDVADLLVREIAEDGTEKGSADGTPISVSSFTVPVIPDPSNPFDATLSLAATAATTANVTAVAPLSTLDVSGL